MIDQLAEAKRHIRALLDASASDRMTGKWATLRINARIFLDRPDQTVEGGEPPTHAMLTAGARAIGNTMRWLNHYERAAEVWRAMFAAKADPDKLPDIPVAAGPGIPEPHTEQSDRRTVLPNTGMSRGVCPKCDRVVAHSAMICPHCGHTECARALIDQPAGDRT